LSSTTIIFVYGSLKAGFHNHFYLKNADFLGTHVTAPLYTMISLDSYPAVLLNGSTKIHGEVYAVSDHIFGNVEELEGYPYFYNRIKIETDYGSAWMYVMEEVIGEYSIVESGIWSIL